MSQKITKEIGEEILREIENNGDFSSPEVQKNIEKLLQKMKDKNAKPYFAYDDLNSTDQGIIENFKNADEFFNRKVEIKDLSSLSYPVEFYKIGGTMKSLIQRIAIIKDGRLLTRRGDEPDSACKDKTSFIKGEGSEACCFRETYVNKKYAGDWKNRYKPFRLRINYRASKNEVSSFFFYLENEKQLDEVYTALFGEKIEVIEGGDSRYRNLNNQLNEAINKNFGKIGAQKVIDDKNKIKKKKALLEKLKKLADQNITDLSKLGKVDLKEEDLRKEEPKEEEPVVKEENVEDQDLEGEEQERPQVARRGRAAQPINEES